MKKVYNDFGFLLTMGAHILDSNSSGNLTPAVYEAGTVLPGHLAVILSVLMVTLVVVVVAGNALVIMAFVVDKSLRTQSNYFFLNLAISDFLVGELVPPPLLLCVSSVSLFSISIKKISLFLHAPNTLQSSFIDEFIVTLPSFLLH
ncbi:histamine H3 receptor-like [Perca fluviatilis]|uniref:histamine H3 receptor-like n=1 Tax=Perca fluviatilis TaxID=8168 RepID=UPI0019666BE4|nr:histamine H3 receptor-like [Perca fluviatilis]